jgi:hypothetical protein
LGGRKGKGADKDKDIWKQAVRLSLCGSINVANGLMRENLSGSDRAQKSQKNI